MVKIKIKKLHHEAIVPNYANSGDAGMDLYSLEDVVIRPNHRALVSTGISMELPKNYVSLIWDKSGIAQKGVTTLAGVIDSGYTGEYRIVLLNVSSKPYKIKKGDKIAQVLIQPVIQPEIEIVDELSVSDRGSGGFGSSGIN